VADPEGRVGIGEYKLYRAALEWDLADPTVIETRTDLKSEKRWRDRLEPYGLRDAAASLQPVR
jgi:hypothetical protein